MLGGRSKFRPEEPTPLVLAVGPGATWARQAHAGSLGLFEEVPPWQLPVRVKVSHCLDRALQHIWYISQIQHVCYVL